MGHACAHIWPYMGQPYRESREEGNSRESLPFPAPSSREGKGREGNPCPVPQRRGIITEVIIIVLFSFTLIVNGPIFIVFYT